jgi:hypothetical protein
VAYEDTVVAVAKSQGAIRELIYSHKGTGVSVISRRPKEGFEALVTVADMPYHVRIMATCRELDKYKRKLSDKERKQEERRVWRVLYWHLKAMFEAADSGVIDIRDVIMPYVVTRDGRTLSDIIKPQMEDMMTVDTSRLMPAKSS